MNWLDGIIGFISPEWGARREAWRQSLTEMRNYDAGNYDRGNANWRVLNQSAEFTDRYSRDNVRARARDLERNSDMMNSVIGAYKRNVIGGGYALQAKTGSDKTNEIIQTAWKKWCKKQNCDVTGTQSFTQMMGFIFYRTKTLIRKNIMLSATRLAKKMERSKEANRGYFHRHIEAMLSYMGWFTCTDTYDCYQSRIKPYIHVGRLKKIISKIKRRQNHEGMDQGKMLRGAAGAAACG